MHQLDQHPKPDSAPHVMDGRMLPSSFTRPPDDDGRGADHAGSFRVTPNQPPPEVSLHPQCPGPTVQQLYCRSSKVLQLSRLDAQKQSGTPLTAPQPGQPIASPAHCPLPSPQPHLGRSLKSYSQAANRRAASFGALTEFSVDSPVHQFKLMGCPDIGFRVQRPALRTHSTTGENCCASLFPRFSMQSNNTLTATECFQVPTLLGEACHTKIGRAHV